jgi:alpha-L-fucosidase
MKKTYCLLLLFISLAATAQPYQPNWQSLDKRPTPQWFTNDKFGIFIHWGVYSVPSYSPKGNYAEWYQQGLQTKDTATQNFHKSKFGNRSYYDLASDFKAELFNPDEWAKLFEKSGAKYIVLTSKHHDGYALWPNETANKTWGFKWNAMDVGPKRDLIGDLFKAVRKTTVRAGMYYSLYEWFNPLWKADPKKYATEHMWPQMTELINNYKPDVFWTDGDWDVPPETWKSQEFLTWLYNESPVKNSIIVNDRWGIGVRFKHGGIYTPEYQPDLDFDNHDWEESRGMGYSYGYNREEDAWDYNSTQSLVIALVDKVSRGGNFLLDIGPDEHGKIPPIMQQRLLEMGDWLKINGEAIYNTSRWKNPSQWSTTGRRDYKPKKEHNADDWKTGGDLMLKLTVDPDSGYAVKEVFYTYNKTTNSLYAIFPKYPDNKKLVLQNMVLPAGTAINFLSTNQNLNWQQVGTNVAINLPDYNPNTIKAPYAYAVKIANYGSFATKPLIQATYQVGASVPTVTIAAAPQAKIYYTTNDAEPTENAIPYTSPFVVNKNTTIKAVAVSANLLSSAIATQQVKVHSWLPAIKNIKLKPGIVYKYFAPDGEVNMNAISGTPVTTGTTDLFRLAKKQRTEKFAFEFAGYINIETEGIYTFYTKSDDGSILYIDDIAIVDNNGVHSPTEKSGVAALRKGFHKIKLTYFDGGGSNVLKASYHLDGADKIEIPAAVLYR